MGRECAGCVPSWEPDVHKPDRVTSQELARGIGCVAATVGTLQQQLRRRVRVFVASDTASGHQLVRAALPPSVPLLSVGGAAAVHSKAERAEADAAGSAAVKLAADLLCLAVADVALALGQSSLSANAVSAGLVPVARVGWDDVCRNLTADELRRLRGTSSSRSTSRR